jgi:transcriptional regulator with XRE-family HTH domain
MDNPLGHFGLRVQQHRKREGLSQAELADELDISRTYLSQIEQGHALNLSLRLAEKLSERLGITPPASVQAAKQEEEEMPASLKAFADQDDIPEQDVRMLARIQYRGRRPQTAQQWRILYSVIKTASEGGT